MHATGRIIHAIKRNNRRLIISFQSTEKVSRKLLTIKTDAEIIVTRLTSVCVGTIVNINIKKSLIFSSLAAGVETAAVAPAIFCIVFGKALWDGKYQ